jgi:hypothetical protein
MSSFLLENLDNYKKEISNDISEIYLKYNEQIFDYLTNILSINIQNNNYIIKKGIEIQTYVFKYIFLYSFNLEMSLYHMRKAQLYYIEFVNQISNESNSFLKLTIKDSALFVYKKTIFDISTNYKSNYLINSINSDKINIINKSIEIFNIIFTYILDLIYDLNLYKNNNDKLIISNTNESLILNNEIDNIKNSINKHINNNLIILINYSLKNMETKQNKSNLIINNEIKDNEIKEHCNNIYNSLESIDYLVNFIINNILNKLNVENENINSINIIKIYKNKINFLTNASELFIKVINKNYINKFYIDKSLIEKKIISFDITRNISDEINDNINNKKYIENPDPLKFINWLIS